MHQSASRQGAHDKLSVSDKPSDSRPLDQFISTETALLDLTQELLAAPWVGIDTEFLRERTFRPRLCLLQTATPRGVACVDPLALDLTPVLAALEGQNLKIGHALRQDFEILYQIRGRLPMPVFDTQVAAALLGYDEQTGYAALVEAELGVQLDKSHTRTDWSARPLSPEQVHYAGNDVRHLQALHQQLGERLERLGRTAWLAEECRRRLDIGRYDDAEAILTKFGHAHRLPTPVQHVLAALIRWREGVARAHDRPRQWIVPDEVLLRIAARQPTEPRALRAIKGLPPAVGRMAEELLAAVRLGQSQTGAAPWPPVIAFTAEEQRRFEVLAAAVKKVAAELGISASLLAPRRELERAARGLGDALVYTGWRQEVLDQALSQARPLVPAPAAE